MKRPTAEIAWERTHPSADLAEVMALFERLFCTITIWGGEVFIDECWVEGA